MERLVSCEACKHGAIEHETTGCTAPRCECRKTLSRLIDEALEAARVEIRREWQFTP